MVRALLKTYHQKYFHGSTETVLNELKRRFFIIGAKNALRALTFRLPGYEPSNRPLKVAKLVSRIMYQLYTKSMSEGAFIYRFSGSLKVNEQMPHMQENPS